MVSYRQDMTAQLTPDQQAVLDHLPADGSTMGNGALQRKLGWETDRYFSVRNSLADDGLIVRGRGRGGTVRRVDTVAPEAKTVSVVVEDGTDPTATIEATLKSELELYEPMRTVIAGDWADDHRWDPLAVEVTALQGRRATGGMWSRPDIVSIEVRTFEYVPGKHLEIASFEIKASNAVNVQAVYEALAHRRAATRAYVLCHTPSDLSARLEETISDVAEAARSHGIGLVTAGDPGDYETWEELVEAQRVEPDPERLNTFIGTQLTAKTRSKVSKRLR